MNMLDVLMVNLMSPLCLAFVLGVITRVIKSEFTLPRDLYASLSIYLLLAIGLKGGVELSQTTWNEIFWPACTTLALGCLTPVTSYLLLRKIFRFNIADSAGIAAHYGSVSAVTFIAAQEFTKALNYPAEGYMPTLLTMLETPGIHIALGMGVILSKHKKKASSTGDFVETEIKPEPLSHVLHEILTARSMILLVGGLILGFCIKETGYQPIKPFFTDLFKGALTLFLLEMGMVAGVRLGDLKHVGLRLISFGIIIPLFHGFLGAYLGTLSGLSIGGATVLAAMSASASYIAAPPAVRMLLPEANPTYYLTASLAITFPFNLILGIPLYLWMAKFSAGN